MVQAQGREFNIVEDLANSIQGFWLRIGSTYKGSKEASTNSFEGIQFCNEEKDGSIDYYVHVQYHVYNVAY